METSKIWLCTLRISSHIHLFLINYPEIVHTYISSYTQSTWHLPARSSSPQHPLTLRSIPMAKKQVSLSQNPFTPLRSSKKPASRSTSCLRYEITHQTGCHGRKTGSSRTKRRPRKITLPSSDRSLIDSSTRAMSNGKIMGCSCECGTCEFD